MNRRTTGVVCALAFALAATTAAAARPKPTADQLCQKARYDAAAKYAQCHQKAMGRFSPASTTRRASVASSTLPRGKAAEAVRRYGTPRTRNVYWSSDADNTEEPGTQHGAWHSANGFS
jgi:hypothetical protein